MTLEDLPTICKPSAAMLMCILVTKSAAASDGHETSKTASTYVPSARIKQLYDHWLEKGTLAVHYVPDGFPPQKFTVFSYGQEESDITYTDLVNLAAYATCGDNIDPKFEQGVTKLCSTVDTAWHMRRLIAGPFPVADTDDSDIGGSDRKGGDAQLDGVSEPDAEPSRQKNNTQPLSTKPVDTKVTRFRQNTRQGKERTSTMSIQDPPTMAHSSNEASRRTVDIIDLGSDPELADDGVEANADLPHLEVLSALTQSK
jgi:hypothetical protein